GIRDRNVTGVQTCALPISLILVKQNRTFSGSWSPTYISSLFLKILKWGSYCQLTGDKRKKEGLPMKFSSRFMRFIGGRDIFIGFLLLILILFNLIIYI